MPKTLQARGRQTCFVDPGAKVTCWGAGSTVVLPPDAFGHPMSGFFKGVPTATAPKTIDLTTVVQVAVGAQRACALRDDGTVWCWGLSSEEPDARVVDVRPVKIAGLSGAVRIVAGPNMCAVLANDTFACFGSKYGVGEQAMAETADTYGTPVEKVGVFTRALPAPAADVVDLVGGSRHYCLATRSGEVLCWGDDHRGKLGGPNAKSVSGVARVPGIGDAIRLSADAAFGIDAGYDYTCAVRASGKVTCWGEAFEGDIYGAPTDIRGVDDAIQVATGTQHQCVLRKSGAVWCRGLNGHGMLGDGTTDNRRKLAPVIGLADAVEIAAGTHHTCARSKDGAVRCWGSNAFGEIGDGTLVDRTEPTAVVGLPGH